MPPTLSEQMDSLWSSTWPYLKAEVIDQIFLKQYPLFFWLSQKKRIRFIDHGRDIRFPLEYDVNPTVTELTRNGTVSLADVDPFTTAIYQWGTIAGNINGYRDDDLENTGRAQIFNLLQAKKNNLIKSMRRRVEQLLFRAEDSTPAGGVNSLLDLVDDTPTSSKTVGGFAQETYDWWRNQARAASGVMQLNLRKDLQQLFYDIEDADGSPTVAVCHRDAYSYYEDDLLEMKIIQNQALADASFEHLVFKGIPLLKSPSCPSTRLWMLDDNYIYLVIHKKMNFEMTKWKDIVNQPFDRAAQIVTRMQLITTSRRPQGTLYNLASS